jgi:hypothetical protein
MKFLTAFLHYFSTALALNVYQTSVLFQHTYTRGKPRRTRNSGSGAESGSKRSKNNNFYSPLHICRGTIICLINEKTVSSPAGESPVQFQSWLKSNVNECLVGGWCIPPKLLTLSNAFRAASRSTQIYIQIVCEQSISCGHLHAAAFITTAQQKRVVSFFSLSMTLLSVSLDYFISSLFQVPFGRALCVLCCWCSAFNEV